jgi:phosphatidylserine/phosphatidylglycerophosphate/cardiolipin synthase-like enzyme
MAKRCRFSFFLCLLVFLGWPARSETQVFFSSQESVEQKLLHLIDDSRSSIDLALFEMRSPDLAEALKRAKQRGVRLRVVLDASHRSGDLPAGEVRWLGGKNPGRRGVMHNKFALFDQARVVTGSYNWTQGAEYANYENALLTDEADTVKAFAGEFETLWQRAIQGPPPAADPNQKRATRRWRAKTCRIRLMRFVMRIRRKAHTYRP